MSHHHVRRQPNANLPVPICDAELAFKLQQAQGAIISDFDRLVHGRLDTNAREHLAMHLAGVATDLLRPIPEIVDGRLTDEAEVSVHGQEARPSREP